MANFFINTYRYITKTVTKRNPTISVAHGLRARVPRPADQLELRNCNIPWVFYMRSILRVQFQPGKTEGKFFDFHLTQGY